MKAFLILEDGTVFTGTSIGSPREVISEIVFNTSMTGYLEVLTDPSYAGQAVVMTYPLIGNYGICKKDMESKKREALPEVRRQESFPAPGQFPAVPWQNPPEQDVSCKIPSSIPPPCARCPHSFPRSRQPEAYCRAENIPPKSGKLR